VIGGNLCLTVREVADEVGISIGACHQFFTEKLQMRRVSAKFVPRLSLLIHIYLAKHQISFVPHPPYSPDLAQEDFFLFPELKTTLTVRRFQTIEEIQVSEIRELRAITESAFQEAFQKWKKLWERCIASGGDYSE
jgi:hypothetical protein